MKDIFLINYPRIGMRIKSIIDSPSIEIHGYYFCGTWGKNNGEYELTSINWQHKNGSIISNDDFLSLAMTS